MALVQLINPATGQVYNVEEEHAENERRAQGWQYATPEQVAEYDAIKEQAAQPVAGRARAAATTLTGKLGKVLELANKTIPQFDAEGNRLPGTTTAEQYAPGAFTPEAKAARAAFPGTSAAADIGSDIAAGVATVAAAPAGVAGVAGALGTEFAVGGVLGEAGAAVREDRAPTLEGAASQGAINVLFAGAGLGVQRLYRAVAPRIGALRETAQKGYRARVSRGAQQDLEDPTVARDFLARVNEQAEDTVAQLDEIVRNYRPAVANNPVAQRSALQTVADGFRARDGAFAESLEEAAALPRQDRFRALVQMRQEATGDAAEALDDLIRRPALWGQKAVSHAETVAAAMSARGGDPRVFADAVRSVDDDGVRKLLGELDATLDDATAANSAQAFRQARSVGAAAAQEVDKLDPATIQRFLTQDDEIVENIKEVAGGAVGTAEKGAVQRTFDAFAETTNNAVKRQDFAAAAPTDAATRAALDVERAAFADQMNDVAKILDEHGVKNRARALRGLSEEIKAAPIENVTGMMDQAKQLLDRIHLSAITNKTEVWKSGDILQAVDPVVERVRRTLENPEFVGPKIAEIQSGRNRAWADPESGFIRNISIAESLGVKLMKKVDIDYKTGRLVMEFDPSSIDTLLRLDAHQMKPVLSAWANVLDSMERMAKSTVEAGASSVGRSPIGELLAGIEDMRAMFEVIDTRLAVQRMAAQGLAGQVEAGGRLAEGLPMVGDLVRKSREVGALRTAEGALKARLARPVPIGSTEASREYLRGLAGGSRGAVPAPSPSPAFQQAMGTVARRRGQEGAVLLESRYGGHRGTLQERYAFGIANDLAQDPEVLWEVAGKAKWSLDKRKDAIRKYLVKKLKDSDPDLQRKPSRSGITKETLGAEVDKYVEDLARLAEKTDAIETLRASKFTEPVPNRPGASRFVRGAPSLEDFARSADAGEAGAEYTRALETIRRRREQAGAVLLGEGQSLRRQSLRRQVTPEQAEALQVYAERGHLDMAPEMVRLVDEAFERTALTPVNRVYRGLDFDASNLKPGDTIPARGYQSTSESLDVARTFADQGESPTILVIADAEGLPVSRKGTMKANEQEYLLPRDVRFKVEKVSKQRVEAEAPPEVRDLEREAEWARGQAAEARGASGEFDGPDYEAYSPEKAAQLWEAEAKRFEDEIRAAMPQSRERTIVHVTAERPQRIDPEDGSVRTGPGIGGILSSPMGITSGVGIAALGAAPAYKSASEYLRSLTAPPASPALGEFATEEEAARYLQAQYEADVDFTARALADPAVAAEYARRNRDQPSTLDLFRGVHETLEQAYVEQRASVQAMRQDPMNLIEEMAESFGDLPEELRSQMAARAFQVAEYLETHLPPLRGVSITRPNGLPPSRLEIRTFALRYMTATDPSTALADAKRGRLRHEQVQTLKALWPQHYDDLRMTTLLAMGNGRSTVAQRQRADLLFGFGAALDPAFSPRLSAAARAAREARDQQATPGSVPSKTRIAGGLRAGGLSALSLGAAAPAA